ncbi:MAG: chemotaxis protein CheW [Oscillospiraceae bacterium]
MAKFEAGMENMVDMYIFETTSLLEQLDQILMKTENESSFGSEDINEIFRTMHTIKGSSSMMGLENMSHLAHAVEDMFFIIREDNPEITDKKTLFDLVFTASDLLKTEIELLQEEEYTPTDFSGHMSKIEAYAKALKEGEGTADAAPAQTAAPAQAAADTGKTVKVISNSGDCMTTVKIYFEDDCKMENLRALLVVNNIKSECSALTYEPSDIEDNSDSAKAIIENGFVIHFRPAADVTQDAVIDIIGSSLNVKSYEVTDAADSGTKEVPLASLSEVKVTFVEDCKMENLRALMVVNNIRESVELLAFSPEDIENDPSTAQAIIENGFTVYFKAAEDQAVVDMIKATPNVKDAVLVRKGGEAPAAGEKAPEKPAEAAAAAAIAPKAEEKPAAPKAAEQKDAKKAAPAVTGGAKQSLISVNLNKLDQLLDIVGEIVITEAMVTSSPDLKVKGLKLDNFQKAARQLRKLNSELQETVMSIRMVPLSGAFNKMTRIVRDMKVKLNKDVDLVFEGEETEVDKSIIDNLNDPLMHMVRNSMDHGIEDTAEERVAKGKPAKGKITLSAYNSSGEVIICVTDDGQGINPEKVLDKAERNGMLTKPRSEYTDKEIFNMIMLPGFSTNEEVTEYSGRGVGMDVVKKNIEKTGGTVSVDSKWGEGTQFTIKIPLSLSIVDGMEISVGQSIFTIPIGVIKESFKVKPNQLLKDTNGSEMVMIRGECYPLIRLYDVFDLTPSSTDINDGIIILVEVESEGKSACLLADELIGEQQVVVKPFSPMLNNFNVKENGMAGCSILGDGSITIILDIGNIISDF